MTGEEKVWVEAEQDGQGGIALTLVDVAERRRVAQEYGGHVVNTSLDRLRNFPVGYTHQLQLGYPVRFRMNLRAFVDMLSQQPSPRPAGFSGAGLGGMRRPRGDWALVRSRGLDDDVISVHKTQEQAEQAMRKRGGEPNSMMQNGMRVVNIGPGGDEMIEVRGKWTIRPRTGGLRGDDIPANEGFPGIDDELENEPPTQDDLNNNAVIQEMRGGYVFVVDSKAIETFRARQHDVPQEAAFQYARAWMDKNKYWPNLYAVNERGNVDLLDHQTGEIIMGWV